MQLITEQKILGRYKAVNEKKMSGETYTPPDLALFVAKEILNKARQLSQQNVIRVLDPAVGDGELLLALIAELKGKGFFSIEVTGYDTNASAVERAQSRINFLHPEVKTSISICNFLDSLTVEEASTLDLFSQKPVLPKCTFDLVIANPPYVRTQILGAPQAAALAKKFNLQGRVDLYYAFLLGLEQVLGENSIVGIIVSNRFMTTKAGVSVRRGLWEKFSIHGIWDFGDTKLFDAAVLPAVLVFSQKNHTITKQTQPTFVSIYSTQNQNMVFAQTSVFDSLKEPGTVSICGKNYEVKVGDLDFGRDSGGVWRIEHAALSEWLATVTKHTYCTFRDVGKIRVGIKTTADNVFIRSDWGQDPENERPELLKHLTTHHIARRFRAKTNEDIKVLYPHEVNNGRRRTIDLERFPKSRSYLEKHRAQLERRKYVIDAGRKWHEIWVPQDPSAWARPKVVFRDISEKPTFWMDQTGSVVNGDCYWICANDEKNDQLLWLILAVANSRFIETYYDHKFNNKLYAGRRRFMTQYVEEFPLPNPKLPLSQLLIAKVKEVYDLLPNQVPDGLEQEIDDLVWKLFGLDVEKTSR